MAPASNKKKKHKNDEETVKCPVDGCGKELLARGLHLHVLQTAGSGHGKSGEIPADVNLDNAEVIGAKEVEMEYPEERESENVQRLCPYCERPFRGKQGVMIHLGATAGRKNHPENAAERYNLDDFPIVRVDENENVIEVVEKGISLPSTERRQEQQEDEGSMNSISEEEIREHIQNLRDQDLEDEADRAEKMLLGD